MVNGAPGFIEDGDTSATEAHAFMDEVILGNQLDPAEVANTLADLSEAEETPEETFLPQGIVEMLGSVV